MKISQAIADRLFERMGLDVGLTAFVSQYVGLVIGGALVRQRKRT